MNISEKGKDLIKSFEGCRLKAYKAVNTERYFTIGWGHYGSDVYEGQVISQEEADRLFDKDIERYIEAVRKAPLGFTPNQNQFDALCSFCYNLGTAIMTDFTNKKEDTVAEEMKLYVNSGGVRLQGLINRRNKEIELFNTPIVASSTVEREEKRYKEEGRFYPNTTINFRNMPNTDNKTNPPIDTYTKGESVNYNLVVVTNKYVWISWVSESTGIRRYMAVREIENGIKGELWGSIV